MPAHVPDQDAPLTAASARRLLAAMAIGALVVAAFSLILTGTGTPTAGVFASVSAALLFAIAAFELVEMRAARRARGADVDGPIVEIEDPERAAVLHALHRDVAILAVDAAITGDVVQLRNQDPAADEEDPWCVESRDVARHAIDALLRTPELLDDLADAAAAKAATAALEPAGADG